jgi:hypothetical protein
MGPVANPPLAQRIGGLITQVLCHKAGNIPDLYQRMNKYTSALETSEHVRAKIRALRAFPELTISEDSEGIKASHGEKMVFQAIQKHAGGPWITRQMKGLFTLLEA